MYKKRIFFGYQMPLVCNENTECTYDDLFDINQEINKYSEFLYVLHDNEEFSKSVNNLILTKGYTIKEIESKFNIKFPISTEKFNTLDVVTQKSICWSRYGIDNAYYRCVRAGYKELIKRNIKFYVPIPILNQELDQVDINKVTLPQDLLEYIHKGKAKLLIYQDAEGFLHLTSHIKWFNDFAKKHKLDKTNFLVESGNQKFKLLCDEYEKKSLDNKNRFDILPSNEFEDRPWFLKKGKQYTNEVKEHYDIFFDYLEYKTQFKYKKKLSALARRFSAERGAIFHKIQTTEVLKENTFSSLHNCYQASKDSLLEEIKTLLLKNTQEVLNWFDQNFDFVNGHSCDLTDQHTNWAADLNPEMHRNTLVNVTIETHQRPSSEIFLSEKTYRPIYTAQPFIIFGNPGTLRVLKEMGYKTFDKFWDESYDDDLPIAERLEKLFDVMIEIAQTPNEVLNRLMEDIEPILRHNFNVLMSNERILNKQKILFNNLYNKEDIYIKKRNLI